MYIYRYTCVYLSFPLSLSLILSQSQSLSLLLSISRSLPLSCLLFILMSWRSYLYT